MSHDDAVAAAVASPVAVADQAPAAAAAAAVDAIDDFAPVISRRKRKEQAKEQKIMQAKHAAAYAPRAPRSEAGSRPASARASAATSPAGSPVVENKELPAPSADSATPSPTAAFEAAPKPAFVPAPVPAVNAWGKVPAVAPALIPAAPTADDAGKWPTLDRVKSAATSPVTTRAPTPSPAGDEATPVAAKDAEEKPSSGATTPRKGKKASWTTLPIPIVPAKPPRAAPASTGAPRAPRPPRRDAKRGPRGASAAKDVAAPAADASTTAPAADADASADADAAPAATDADVASTTVQADAPAAAADQHARGHQQRVSRGPRTHGAAHTQRQHHHQQQPRQASAHGHYSYRTPYPSAPTPAYSYTHSVASTHFTVDTDTLKLYIQKQVEYYFSVDNLCKDLYIRQHMDATQGWVPLTVLAAFNRVKLLTDSLAMIADALIGSTVVEVSADRLGVRPRDDWQRWILAPEMLAAITPAVPAVAPAAAAAAAVSN
ncbi:hypothetical protein AMAG_13979 [Allomyces macrogynus ATCC 38327]|uniref:HTH La-type RNA-binding domain-containing protein n=1 Tax=Allomyces macrogynus (strain ATCC 38327) TaxID=578462 RepID=A0A0L0T331_ALLM3|nr:hypothetical protein AMAG_13979 [Allomyces macrogynus ATCC 38327]|eukprot:KNE69122.1 hypothetical protein AMAG_13979 [Allomyces macrogynus ATCC 38327]